MKPQIATVQPPEASRWKLERAVLVYLSHDPNQGAGLRSYATVHEVSHAQTKAGPRLGAGVPATREACADLARALGANAAIAGFVPASVLYIGANCLMWWRAPGRARVFFDTTKAAAGDQPDDKSGAALIGKRNAEVMNPGLVFAVTARGWYVYAVAGDMRPDEKTPLFRAPYFNVWASGQICTGNVRLPERLSPAAIASYERAFFDSEFTHPNVRGKEKLANHPGGPYAFWSWWLAHSTKHPRAPFQYHPLVPLNLTLAGLAKRLEKGSDQ